MSPYGFVVRRHRNLHNITLKDMAEALAVKSSYLSALELGKKGKPNQRILDAVVEYFNLDQQDEAELRQAADISDPKMVLMMSGKASPSDYVLAHLIKVNFDSLNEWQRELIFFALNQESSDSRELNNLISNLNLKKGERLCA